MKNGNIKYILASHQYVISMVSILFYGNIKMILDNNMKIHLSITSDKKIYLFTDPVYHHSTHTKLQANLWQCQRVELLNSSDYALSGEPLHYICLHDLLLGSGFTNDYISKFLNTYGKCYYLESNHANLTQPIRNQNHPPYTKITILPTNKLNTPHILVHKLIHSDVLNLLVPCYSASFWQCTVSVFINLTNIYTPEHPQHTHMMDRYNELLELLAPHFILPIDKLTGSNMDNPVFIMNFRYWQGLSHKFGLCVNDAHSVH